jgi:phosphotransferase system enzyme I (PtsP)
MVTHVDEVYETYALIKRAYEELQDEGYHLTFPQFGIMLEVPGLIYELVQIMEIVDFISVGTNDLAQYIFAVDRTNAKVSSLYGHLYPALLNSLNHIRSVTQRFDKEVSICGEMTSSPLASPLLVGLGFRSLSMNAVVLPKIKWILRHLSSAECENIAYKALQKRNKDQVHKLMSRFLVDHRLGALIGADKGYDG